MAAKTPRQRKVAYGSPRGAIRQAAAEYRSNTELRRGFGVAAATPQKSEMKRAITARAAAIQVTNEGGSSHAAREAAFAGALNRSFRQAVQAGHRADAPKPIKLPTGKGGAPTKNVVSDLASVGLTPQARKGISSQPRGKMFSDGSRRFIAQAMNNEMVKAKIGTAARMNRSKLGAARTAIIELADRRTQMGLKAASLKGLRAVQTAAAISKAKASSVAYSFAGKATPKGDPNAGGVNRAQLRDAIVLALATNRKNEKLDVLKANAIADYNNRPGSGKPIGGAPIRFVGTSEGGIKKQGLFNKIAPATNVVPGTRQVEAKTQHLVTMSDGRVIDMNAIRTPKNRRNLKAGIEVGRVRTDAQVRAQAVAKAGGGGTGPKSDAARKAWVTRHAQGEGKGKHTKGG